MKLIIILFVISLASPVNTDEEGKFINAGEIDSLFKGTKPTKPTYTEDFDSLVDKISPNLRYLTSKFLAGALKLEQNSDININMFGNIQCKILTGRLR